MTLTVLRPDSHRLLWRGSLTALLLMVTLVLLSAPAEGQGKAAKRKKPRAAALLSHAEQQREALNGKPVPGRTARDYDRAVQAFRAVYYSYPASPQADDAVVGVAELLADRARALKEPKAYRDAIGQYEFLRREYPGSPHRMEALFIIATIYREDLNEETTAKTTYDEFLKRYPGHRLATEAKDALREMSEEGTRSAAKRKTELAKTGKSPGKATDRDALEAAETEPSGPRTKLPRVTSIRFWSSPDYTRVAIDLEEEVKYEAGRVANPDRIFFDLHDAKIASELIGKTFDSQEGFLRRVRVAQYDARVARVVLEVNDISGYSAFLLPNPHRLIIDIHGKTEVKPADTLIAQAEAKKTEAEHPAEEEPEVVVRKPGAKERRAAKTEEPPVNPAEEKREIEAAKSNSKLTATNNPTSKPTVEKVTPRSERAQKRGRKKEPEPEAEARTARPATDGSRSLVRALGLKIGRIVIDAGHGGHDTGALGPNGYAEKDLTLDVALKLGKLLENKLGAEVIYTRNDDTFIPLETRTAIANKEQADLFISIHANSSESPSARGVEVYYLNFTSDAAALEVAARENAVSEKSIYELQDLVKKIAMREKIDESREFASEVLKSLHTGLASRDKRISNRGVKKAPFIVLIGANMPSILAEVSFISNPLDERRLKTADYRKRMAEHLYKGVASYVGGLSGVKVAARSGELQAQAEAP